MFVSTTTSHGRPVQQRLFSASSHCVRPSARKLIAKRNAMYTFSIERTGSPAQAYEDMALYTEAVCEVVLNERLEAIYADYLYIQMVGCTGRTHAGRRICKHCKAHSATPEMCGSRIDNPIHVLADEAMLAQIEGTGSLFGRDDNF